MKNKIIRWATVLSFVLSIVGCEPCTTCGSTAHVHQVKVDQHEKHSHKVSVQSYSEKIGDDLIYWYIFSSVNDSPRTSNNNNISQPVAYYRSTSPVTNFSTISPTPVRGGALPIEVKEEVENAQEVEVQELAPEAVPEQLELDFESEINSEQSGTVDSTESTSATESSGSDSGGASDGGGGGD